MIHLIVLITRGPSMNEEFYAEMERLLLNLRKEILESIAAEDEDFRGMINAMGIKTLGRRRR